MNLYLNGSNREKNCYQILKDLKEEKDIFISLANQNISYCLGCSSCCMNKLQEYCVIEDDMQKIYQNMLKAEKIVIASPIYMNFITGILKNVIDRWNPYSTHEELLKGKKIYFILTGQLEQEENQEIIENISSYMEGLAEFMEFDFQLLGYLSSGDIESIDDVIKNNENYHAVLKEWKKQIKNNR